MKFFDYLKIKGSLKEQAREFSKRAKGNPEWTTFRIIEYIQAQKERVEKKELFWLQRFGCTIRKSMFDILPTSAPKLTLLSKST